MTHWLPYLLAAAGAAGILFGLVCYGELRRWARQCQRARIAIAHKRRVQLEAPLVEWLEWSNALGRDESARGRIIYRNGPVSVAILKPAPPKVERVSRRRLLAERLHLARRPRQEEAAA